MLRLVRRATTLSQKHKQQQRYMSTAANLLRFDYSAEQLAQETNNLIAKEQKLLDQVGAFAAEQCTFDSVVKPLALSEALFSTLSSNVTFPGYVSTDKGVRDASSEAQKKIEEFEIESTMREDVFKALKAVKDAQYNALKPDEQRVLTRMLRDYERNGLGLPKEKRDKVKELKTKLSGICIEFQKNISEDNTSHAFTEEELEGLPADFVEQLKKDDTGKRVVSLKYPELIPVLRYAKIEQTRKIMETLNSSKCMDKNVVLFEQALQIRNELADLLGFDTHAAYVLDVRMAKSPEQVFKFLHNLRDQLMPGAKKELATLLQYKANEKKERSEQFDGQINAWDYNYYSALLKEKEYSVNENLIKDYFPVDHTLKGLLDIAQETYRIKFQEVENAAKWHEDVRLFNVLDADTNDFCGQFYLDLYPREGKYSHAAAFPLQMSFERADGTKQFAVSALVCNFTKPTATKPALLKHDEVVTLFHEFGHGMHGFCSKAKYGRFSGTSVERDFVECPSQYMEYYCWEKEGLQRMSSHYQTGAPLPDDLIEKMIAAKNVGVGLFNLRQLFFGIFDMQCHTTKGAVNSAELYSKLRTEVSLIPNTANTNGSASFGHLMGGYDCGYYGYLWSQVYCADIFSAFKQNGIFNPAIGKKYRNAILEQGGMKDGMEMLVNFLGREPNDEFFLTNLGLKE